jgi:hypothetical protein
VDNGKRQANDLAFPLEWASLRSILAGPAFQERAKLKFLSQKEKWPEERLTNGCSIDFNRHHFSS